MATPDSQAKAASDMLVIVATSSAPADTALVMRVQMPLGSDM